MSFPNLLSPFINATHQFQNRIVMAALTRCRADFPGIPNDIMVQYYGMRGDCGFILTECSPISPLGNVFPGSGGIWTEEMVYGWKKVTDAVHAKGAKMCIQIWHGGRVAKISNLNGQLPLCSSPIRNRFDPEYPVPKEMTKQDIEEVLEQFYQGAINAKKAGFDMIELHGANGYLIDQFIRDNVNQRTDEYGGSIENRCRFPLQVIDKLCEVFTPQNVGIKLSPVGRSSDMFDSDPIPHYSYLIQQLNERKICFVEMMEPSEWKELKYATYPNGKEQIPEVYSVFRPLFNGIYIANCGLSVEKGEELVKNGKCDLVSFGRFFISNPDLVQRVQNGQELNTNWNASTFYTKGPEGYIDYPLYEEWKKSIGNS